jgi:hypothetical protein
MKIEFVDVPEETPIRLQMLSICNEAKTGATRGYIEMRMRTVLSGTRWSNMLKALVLESVPDEKFLMYVYNVYMCIIGQRAPKTGRKW